MAEPFMASDDLRERLSETPYYSRYGQISKFSHIEDEAMGIGNAQLVVFEDGATLWPNKAEKKMEKGSFLEEVPDEYELCDVCESCWSKPGGYHGRFTDDLHVCTEECLRDYLDRETEPESDGRVRDEGTKLY